MKPSAPFRRVSQSGFTLVEIAIVLAVIGLILGAVMIGKDIQQIGRASGRERV